MTFLLRDQRSTDYPLHGFALKVLDQVSLSQRSRGTKLSVWECVGFLSSTFRCRAVMSQFILKDSFALSLLPVASLTVSLCYIPGSIKNSLTGFDGNTSSMTMGYVFKGCFGTQL